MPMGSGGLGPRAMNRSMLRSSSSSGSSYGNEICSMGFALEHHIKFTSGVGVNGGGLHLLALSRAPGGQEIKGFASPSSSPLWGMAASEHPAEEGGAGSSDSSRK